MTIPGGVKGEGQCAQAKMHYRHFDWCNSLFSNLIGPQDVTNSQVGGVALGPVGMCGIQYVPTTLPTIIADP